MKKNILKTIALVSLACLLPACSSDDDSGFLEDSKNVSSVTLKQYAESKNVVLNVSDEYISYERYEKLKSLVNELASLEFVEKSLPGKGFPRKRSSAESSGTITPSGGTKTVTGIIWNTTLIGSATWAFYHPSGDKEGESGTAQPQGSASLSLAFKNPPSRDYVCTPQEPLNKNVIIVC